MKKIFLLLTAVLTAGMLSAETIYGDCGTNMEWSSTPVAAHSFSSVQARWTITIRSMRPLGRNTEIR